MSLKHKDYLPAVGLVILTMAVFWQVTDFEFVQFDDGVYVANNTRLWDGFSWDDVGWAFSTTYFGNWHPLVWLSYMADAWVFGKNPGGFHLTNIVLHTANVVLLFVFLSRTTGAVGKSAFVAAVFAVHPLHVESVAWVSSRKDVLSTLFGIVALICYCEYSRSRRPKWYLATLMTFICSLMSKQMLVTLPFVMLLMDAWPLNRLRAEPAVIPRSRKCLILEKSPFFVITAMMCVVAYFGQQSGGGTQMIAEVPLGPRILNAVLAYGLYLARTIWPWNLAVFYPHPGEALSMPAVAISAMAILAISLATVKLYRRHPYVLVGWLWFLGTLIPVIGLVQIGRQQLADRYMYFPMIGILMAVTWLAAEWPRRRIWKEILLPKLACVLVAVLAIAGWLQTGYWKDSETLFTRAIDVTENNSLMHFNLGRTLHENRQSNAAIAHYRRAIEIDPNYAKPHSSWAVALAEQKIFVEARKHFQRAVELEPRMLAAHTGLGNIELALRNYDAAVKHFHDAIAINSRHANAHYNLGLALHQQENYDKALAEFDLAARLAVDNRQFLTKLVKELNDVGKIRLKQGDATAAAAHFRNARQLKLSPHFSKAREKFKRATGD